MNDTLFATQQAVMNALNASTEIRTLLGNPPAIYDHVPPNAIFPYVVFGTTQILPHDTKTEIGFEQIITLDIWSRYRGGKEARDIFQAIYNTLHRAALSVSGQVFLSCEFHSADFITENDGLTTQATLRFSLLTQST